MPYRTFQIPVRSADWAERELNTFLASHRVLAVDRRWVDQGENSFWAVWVDYLDSPTESSFQSLTASDAKKKVDYKEILSPEDFAVFAQLRALRKELAAEDGVALYNIFTNEQLAQIVQRQTRTLEQLKAISGIGQARIDKYGPRVLELLNTTQEGTDEASRQSSESDR